MARSEVNFIYDADNAFRAPGSDALTATGAVGALPLDKLVNVRPGSQRNTLGAETYHVIVCVEDIATSGADETYTLSILVGETDGASTEVATISVTTVGQYVVALDGATIEKLDEDREEIALSLDVAGAAPSVKFAAWLV